MKYYILIVCVLACFALGGCKTMRSAHRSRGVYRSIPSYRGPSRRYRSPASRRRSSSPSRRRSPPSRRRR